MPERKRILMYWGYHRKGWTKPFEALSDQFEFIYLFHFDQAGQILERPELQTRYFSEFSNIRNVFDDIKPDKMIFIGLDGLLSLLLNQEAKRRNIKTLLVQHGFLYKLEDQLAEFDQERLNAKTPQTDAALVTHHESLRKYSKAFLIKSIGLRNILFFLKTAFVLYKHRGKSDHEKMLKLKSGVRLADHYLLYAPYFSQLYVKRDQVEDRIQFIGNHEADDILEESAQYSTDQSAPYLLHIDQPVLHAYKGGVQAKYEPEEGQQFYLKLAEVAQHRGWKLVVKLHPYSYVHLDLYPHHANIEYVKQHDSLTRLIQQSTFITGFYSTLILPAILLKPTLLFEITRGLQFFEDLKKDYQVPVLPFDFSVEEMLTTLNNSSKPDLEVFTQDFFYKTNGKAIERLAKVLNA